MQEEEVRYEKISLIGQGAYGSVYKCIDMKTKSTVAMKIIKMDKSDQGISSTTLRELSILRSLSHPNIVKLIDQRLNYFGKEPQVELVFEYAEQDLSKIIKRSGCGLPAQLVKDYMKQILIGVDYMHNQRVFHRDLKPQNLLINSEGVIKIADFGLGRIVNFPLHTMSKQIETLWYRAPQLLLGCCRYDLAVDLWSVGCIFYELAQGRVLFQSDCELGQIMAIFQILGTPHLKQWEQLVGMPHFKTTFPKFEPVIKWPCKQLCGSGLNLLQRLLRANPKERIKVKEALNHDYFMH